MDRPHRKHRKKKVSHRPQMRWIVALSFLLFVTAGIYAAKKNNIAGATEQKRALHALDRLTFGPRPGDVQAVAAMGVDKWIQVELHPEKIDNAAMQAGWRGIGLSK